VYDEPEAIILLCSRLMLKPHVKYVAYIENGVLSIHLAILILFSFART
jgi:hypothetical protein